MPHSHGRSPSRVATAVVLVTGLAAFALSGCSDNKPAPNSPGGSAGSTTYKGTISGSGTSGSLTLTIATATPSPQPAPARARATVTATGTLIVSGGGGTIPLTGSYDDVANTITVGGSGWTFTGSLTSFGLEGGFGGPGPVSGVFSVQTVGSGADTVIVVVGTFTSTTGSSNGVFNFAIRGTVLHGNAYEDGATKPFPLDGTYTPSTGVISIVHPTNPTGPPVATGTLAANGTASGTYDDQSGNAGNWTGTKQ